MTTPRTVVVLPARYASTRFPGKPLAVISGRPLIEWVYLRAREIGAVDRVVVATDDERIADTVRGFGGDVVMTASDHRSGTDRVAEVARRLDHDIVVNLQGDEPVFSPALIEQLVEAAAHTGADIVTACHRISERAEIDSPHVVKVVFDNEGRAMYFSRAPIPHTGDAWRHIGIYVFQRDALLRFTTLPPSTLEKTESLEQLRALENGMSIRVVVSDVATVGVDVPDDIKDVEKVLRSALD